MGAMTFQPDLMDEGLMLVDVAQPGTAKLRSVHGRPQAWRAQLWSL